MERQVPLSRGLVAIVDNEDYERVIAKKWCAVPARQASARWYAVSRSGGATLYMHRFILYAQPGELVDHADGDGLRNIRRNLRLCTRSQNNRNKVKLRGESAFVGVVRSRSAWKAQIRIDGRRIYLGTFSTDAAAALAYDAAAIAHCGGFAKLNFPDDPGVA